MKFLFLINLTLAVALFAFCVPLVGHGQSLTSAFASGSHFAAVQSIVGAVHTGVIALVAAIGLLMNSLVCLFSSKKKKKA